MSDDTRATSMRGLGLNWIDSYRIGAEYLQHLDGVEWADAPRPRRWHRCRPQTRGYFDRELVERCACGGVRFDGDGPWVNRNSW